MHLHAPSVVLVPDTFISAADAGLPTSTLGTHQPRTTSLLVQCILEEFEGVPVEPVLRKYWSEGAGTPFLHASVCMRLKHTLRVF